MHSNGEIGQTSVADVNARFERERAAQVIQQQAMQDYLGRHGSALAGTPSGHAFAQAQGQQTNAPGASPPLEIADKRIRDHAARLLQVAVALESFAARLDGEPPGAPAANEAHRPERSGSFGRIADGLDALDAVSARVCSALGQLHKLIG